MRDRRTLRRFLRHRVGILGTILFLFLAVPAVFADFFAPYGVNETDPHTYAPPQGITFVDADGQWTWRPHVRPRTQTFNLETGRTTWTSDPDRVLPIRFFVAGARYRVLGFQSRLHLYGLDDGRVALLGTDGIGRDVFSRILHSMRVSLGVAALTTLLALALGTTAGIVSGFFGGATDNVIQRIVELFLVVPSIPLGLALAAVLPPDLPAVAMVAGIAVVLALVGWANVARQVRGLTLAVRDQEFVTASRAVGARTGRTLALHVAPSMRSHLIVLASLILPQSILAESGLSFLGFGVRAPVSSLGTLLRDAQNFRTIELHPWLLLAGVAIMLLVLTLNFVGDGVRDALDPYGR